MSAGALERALVASGIACAVDGHGTLAVLVPRGDAIARLASPAARDAVQAMAREHGFTHAAVELTDDVAHGAPLPGD